jgi:two-component system, cell cycle sensor histidine kinase and response regulator CckA
VAVATEVIFAERFGVELPPYPVFGLAILISLRFRQAGVAVATLVVSIIAAWHTADALGPFSTGATVHDVAVLDGYLVTVAVTGLVIAALLSERVTAERLLGEREERFRLLIENASDVVMVVDREGTITYLSPAGEQVIGIRQEGLVGRPLADRVHEADRSAVVAAFAGAAESPGTNLSVEFRYRHRDGSYRSIEAVCTGRLDDPRIAGVIATLRDVTERERWEAQLRQAQRMDAVGRLAGGITHDFNNLLTAVIGYSAHALRGLRPHDPLRGDLEQIKRAGERATVLTRQLLAFSRGQPVEPVVLDVNAVIAELEPLLLRLVREDIQFETGLHAGGAHVLGDQGQIEQVIVNLAVNASDAMPDGGTLAITTEDVELDADYFRVHAVEGGTPGSYLLLQVTDSGIGMDEETISHIFEPFYSSKREGEGTGLGLATVYGVVRQSRGFLRVYSEPGLGATFKVYLPAVEAAGESEPTREPAAPRDVAAPFSAHGRTVLLVEDDGGVRALVRLLLEEYEFEILEASSGDDALALSEASPGDAIHLLVTDTVLPGLGGIELAHRVRARHPSLVTLVMSGYSETLAIGGSQLPEGTTFIAKPFNPTDFTDKLQALVAANANR